MKLVIQRVNNASVTVDDEVVGSISKGLVVLVGFSKNFDSSKLDYMIRKVLNLRLFSSEDKGFDLSVSDIKGEILVVSQFTLHGKVEGNRVNFNDSMEYSKAEEEYNNFVKILKEESELKVETGKFGAMMKVSLENDGPVTVILDK